MYKLIEVKPDQEVVFQSVSGGRQVVQRLTDMGLIPGERLKVLQNSGSGPITVLVKGTRLAIGREMAGKIRVKDRSLLNRKKLTIALAGNPNSGKSTIFNNLTGARQHVGNYPGVTVEKREGTAVYKNYNITVVDLPGTYSLSAHSEDEVVARNYIIQDKPDVIVGIVDCSNLERNLYLVTQLMELNLPMVLAFNMSDIASKNGQNIDYDELSKLLGLPIVETVGTKSVGTNELLAKVVTVYEGLISLPKKNVDYGPEVNEEISALGVILSKDQQLLNRVSLRWLVIKLLEDDSSVKEIIEKSFVAEEAFKQVEKSRKHLKAHFGDQPEIIIADRRYGFISGACTEAVHISSVERRHDLSDKIDQIVLSRFFGIPIFALVMYLIFEFTFMVSSPLVNLFGKTFDLLGNFVLLILPRGLLQSFLVDGIINGVGGVLGFFPLILFMFLAIAFFEDSGYMARAAFVMDRLLSKFGLGGKSFLPLMISTNGCAVAGIMAARTLENKRDRLITVMVTPFMICGAKLPIFALFIAAFFPREQGSNIMFLMYALSILVAFSSAYVLKRFVFKGETTHFVMELPPYRIPTFRGLLLKMWERGWLYLKKAGTTILFLSIVVWAAFTFPDHSNNNLSKEAAALHQLNNSYAGKFGTFIEPL
ncbi:MAG: ferrous iron transport protein B, partial [Candidatus Omnitrophica bacterium]|nr:ferrous iron transport protein B [Candidatus Omnitrophota bacterium]